MYEVDDDSGSDDGWTRRNRNVYKLVQDLNRDKSAESETDDNTDSEMSDDRYSEADDDTDNEADDKNEGGDESPSTGANVEPQRRNGEDLESYNDQVWDTTRVAPNGRSMGSGRYRTSQEIAVKDLVEDMQKAISTKKISLARNILNQIEDNLQSYNDPVWDTTRVDPNVRSMGGVWYRTSQEIGVSERFLSPGCILEKDLVEEMDKAISTKNVDLTRLILEQNKEKLKKRQVRRMVMVAIKERHYEFVSLFIETGLLKKKFITAQDIRELYENIKDIESLMKADIFHGIKIPLEEGDKLPENTRGIEYIFVYCLLVPDHEMAKLLWTELDEPLAFAVFAENIYRIVDENRKDYDEHSEKLRQNGREFTTLAIKVIDSLHREGCSSESLIRKLTKLKDKSCLTAAAGNKHFMSRLACQELLDDIWWDRVTLREALSVEKNNRKDCGSLMV
ncbi:uncharacterized protein LOC130013125 [Patella vulgata]|uniref:uncharacterized protein LOC130013125 n=1 Tax=Patella vulgata TaxID=6465 RepID=UPI0024A9D32C|nr:uncharacterized protein LOC130013125 [Patella vulgata]